MLRLLISKVTLGTTKRIIIVTSRLMWWNVLVAPRSVVGCSNLTSFSRPWHACERLSQIIMFLVICTLVLAVTRQNCHLTLAPYYCMLQHASCRRRRYNGNEVNPHIETLRKTWHSCTSTWFLWSFLHWHASWQSWQSIVGIKIHVAPPTFLAHYSGVRMWTCELRQSWSIRCIKREIY